MKYLIVVLMSATVLVGCRGGSTGSTVSAPSSPVTTPSTTTTTPTPSATPNAVITPSSTAPAYDLVIDNGRGTTNNQNTEIPK